MNSDSFRDAVYMVSQGLRPEESQDIAYLYDLPERFHHTRTITVLRQLEHQQHISRERPETLAIMMDRIKRADLAGKVRKMIKKKKKQKSTEEGPQARCMKYNDHHGDLLHCELEWEKMQMEHTTHRINKLQEHLHHWSMAAGERKPSLNSTANDFKKALEYCHKISLCLSNIERRMVPDSSTNGSSSSSSSCNSSTEDIPHTTQDSSKDVMHSRSHTEGIVQIETAVYNLSINTPLNKDTYCFPK